MRSWGLVDAETCARYVARSSGPSASWSRAISARPAIPIPADGLGRFVTALAEHGLARADLDVLGIGSPRRLLGLATASSLHQRGD